MAGYSPTGMKTMHSASKPTGGNGRMLGSGSIMMPKAMAKPRINVPKSDCKVCPGSNRK